MSRELKHELNLDFSFLSSFFRIEKSKKIEKLFQDWVSHIEKKNLFLSCFTNFVSRERERGKKIKFHIFFIFQYRFNESLVSSLKQKYFSAEIAERS